MLETTARPGRRTLIGALCGAMVLLYAIVLATPPSQSFFELVPGPALPASLAGAALAAAGLWLTDERFFPARR